MDKITTREELIELVKKIIAPGNTEEEDSKLIQLLESKVAHPRVTDLIFYENLTPEQIVDKALEYKPFYL